MKTKTVTEILAAVNSGPSMTRHDVVGYLGDIAILEAYSNAPFKESPFTGAILRDGKWKPTRYYSESADKAMLRAFGCKYDSCPEHFATFAARMLGIES